ncbi:hypothetical protein FXF65_03465 [Actinomadura syzygii]|uniref:Uncharacterized protein n=1 Tax=Actinomadura syzygii TaxID=1427538 RepID=A0A5D0UP46_9ACTN|nr:hypothetical protein FXF65_03465 [Actinomadura syzygii]
MVRRGHIRPNPLLRAVPYATTWSLCRCGGARRAGRGGCGEAGNRATGRGAGGERLGRGRGAAGRRTGGPPGG